MDKITESLKQYLNSVGIPHQTIFNSEGGIDMGYPTSTGFHRENVENPQQRTLIVVDIYPTDKVFWITSCPTEVFRANDIDKLRAFETKWNRSGMNMSLNITEEQGRAEPNRHVFQLAISGYYGDNGLKNIIWEKYIESIENNTYLIWKDLQEMIESKESTNTPVDSIQEENKTAITDESPF